jgi:hypothetical protein
VRKSRAEEFTALSVVHAAQSPLTIACLMARQGRTHFGCSICAKTLLAPRRFWEKPFYNPIRLAEDIAIVDIISGGRFELGVGIGFKREEFSGFGVSSKQRGARTDQSLDIIRRALAGETVTFKSEFFDFQNVRVTPAMSRSA